MHTPSQFANEFSFTLPHGTPSRSGLCIPHRWHLQQGLKNNTSPVASTKPLSHASAPALSPVPPTTAATIATAADDPATTTEKPQPRHGESHGDGMDGDKDRYGDEVGSSAAQAEIEEQRDGLHLEAEEHRKSPQAAAAEDVRGTSSGGRGLLLELIRCFRGGMLKVDSNLRAAMFRAVRYLVRTTPCACLTDRYTTVGSSAVLNSTTDSTVVYPVL